LEIPHWVESVGTVFGSGGAGWFAAWLKHRRLKSAPVREEKKLKGEVDGLVKRHEELSKRIEGHISQLAAHIEQYKSNNAGWLLELTQIKNELEEDKRIREAIEVERNSRPDPLEDIRHDIDEVRRLVERLRDKSGRYVKNEAFEAFVRSQEEQWREMNRNLGMVQGELKSR
jgi:chromosome segregation ATPase